MFDSFNKDKYSWLLVIALLLAVIQVTVAGWGFLFPACLFGSMVYYGRNHRKKPAGKLILWIGLFGLALTLLSLFVFRLVILGLVLLFLVDFIQKKRHPLRISPDPEIPNAAAGHTTLLNTVLRNKWFGYQKTPEPEYPWQDINIQTGAGDTVIDLSRTILPKKGAVIFIRHLAGRIRILVPYDVGVSLHYSIMLGQMNFFGRSEARLINKSVTLQSEGYEEAGQKVKVFVSAVAGSLEVKRV
ncbi:cell wall-active antibiotics response protein LiaF [Sporolactobacillus vineae]|uniref:cell wall-active antibiotics response protein LiaF n=1 Tax=Sporolactobacillus vineae TaxID=444463 RepID=UPI000289DA5D|nr:cell wall-active antibiotics response protein LiaF [Sporolactobacillus vineae]